MSLDSQGRDLASLSWNCPRNWLLVKNQDETCFCNFKVNLFISLICVEYLLYVRHSSGCRQYGEE